MKAAYANGVLTAFEQAGHRPFDAVYGTSAGGALAAWFTAGQAEYAEETWDYAADSRILSYRRAVLGRGPVLDHDALLEIVYETEHPIDQEAIRKAPWPVVVTAVEVQTGRTRYQDLRHGPIIPWLKATGRLPFGAGRPVRIGDHDLLDGGINDPLPVRRAVEDGATEVTVILNSPPGQLRKDNALLAQVTARRYPALRDGILRHHEVKQAAYTYAESPPDGVRIHLIRPTCPTGLHRLSRGLEDLRRAIGQGRRDGEAFLDGRDGE